MSNKKQRKFWNEDFVRELRKLMKKYNVHICDYYADNIRCNNFESDKFIINITDALNEDEIEI